MPLAVSPPGQAHRGTVSGCCSGGAGPRRPGRRTRLPPGPHMEPVRNESAPTPAGSAGTSRAARARPRGLSAAAADRRSRRLRPAPRPPRSAFWYRRATRSPAPTARAKSGSRGVIRMPPSVPTTWAESPAARSRRSVIASGSVVPSDPPYYRSVVSLIILSSGEDPTKVYTPAGTRKPSRSAPRMAGRRSVGTPHPEIFRLTGRASLWFTSQVECIR